MPVVLVGKEKALSVRAPLGVGLPGLDAEIVRAGAACLPHRPFDSG